LTPQQQKQQTLDAVVAWTLEEAERRPVLQVWEDLHWADPSTLELLALEVEQAPTAPILTLLTFRPEFTPPWAQRSHMTPLTLNRLERPEVETLITEQADGKALPGEVVEHIVSKADGVPLYVEELTKAILEADFLREEKDRYTLEGTLSTVTIPATLQDSLMARLDRLPTIREIAQLGAVLGREFTYEMVQAIASMEETTLRNGLDQLVGAELLYLRGRPPRAKYIFKHALVQDVAYESLLKRTRRKLHQRVAEVLTTQLAVTVENAPEIVAHHYAEAGLAEDAISCWLRAGQRAVQASANAEAVHHFEKALELLQASPEGSKRWERELKIQLGLAVPLLAAKGYAAPEVEKAYSRAQQLCERLEKSEQLFPVLRGRWNHYLVRGELERARNMGTELMSLAEAQNDPLRRALANRALGSTLFSLGRFEPSRRHLERGIASHNPDEFRAQLSVYGEDPSVVCRLYLALTLWYMGWPDKAQMVMHDALALSEQLSHAHSAAFASFFAGVLHDLRREFGLAQRLATAAIETATEHGLAQWLAEGLVARGFALAATDQEDEGIAQLCDGIARYEAIGARQKLTQWYGFAAEAYRKAGQIEQSFDALKKALEMIERTREGYYQAELFRLKGALLLDTGAEDEAEGWFIESMDFARRQNARSLELRAATSLARLWQDQGKIDKAHDLLAPIYDWFTEGFDTPDLIEAKELLNALK
jgi:tetratricopeptide (TPR) repeat protein